LSVCLFVCLSVCLFVCLSVCLFVCLSVYGDKLIGFHGLHFVRHLVADIITATGVCSAHEDFHTKLGSGNLEHI